MQSSLPLCHKRSYRLNHLCVKPTDAGLLVDRVVPEPHKVGFDCKCSRESPVRYAFGVNKSDLLWLAEDIKKNIDKWNYSEDPDVYKVDEEVFGDDRGSLDKLIGKKSVRLTVQELQQKKDLLNTKAKAILKTPVKAADETKKDVVPDW